MKGTITKRHCLLVAREFGWLTALRLIISRRPIALQILVGFKTLLIGVMILGAWMASQPLGAGQIRIWHDLDGDNRPDVAVTYTIQIIGENANMVEAGRTYDPAIVNITNPAVPFGMAE